ncbi:bacterial low temperature requirement A protein [Glomus cerebriforme]|uniref:Bacterial low temperature requirement A protein n=1 Tax=Glomus cerebriforme TaxID=658196 RepID=A0A397SCM1_9GLOM|nr:bacterial low temperature requirement A protein [Glomus cerebriforme]
MTDQNDNNNENNKLDKLDNPIPNDDRVKDPIPNTSNNDLEIVIQENPLEYSKKLQIGGKNLLIVDKEEDVVSGEAPRCCIVGSLEHVAALKAKIGELKSHSEQLEREHREALLRSESVSNQLDTLAKELSQLGHHNDASKNGEQTIHATIHTFGPLQNLEIIDDDDSTDDEDHDHKFDRLMRQPRIRQYWYKNKLHREAGERKVSFTELFWDLIFVAVIGNLGHDLVGDISGVNIERFILTFYPIYKIWLDMTIYMNLYNADDLFEMFFLLFEMVLVITMGTHASDIFHDTVSIYLISYVIARMAFMFLHILHAVWIPLFRISFVNSAWGVFIPSVIWFIAIFVPSDRTTLTMWIAIIFENLWTGFMPLYIRFGRRLFHEKVDTQDEVVVDTTRENIVEDDPSSPTIAISPTTSTLPMSQVSTATSRTPHKAMRTRGTEYEWKWKDLFSLFKVSEYRTALNIEHYSERLGLFAIIALGEGILGVLYTSFNPQPDGQLGKAILGLLIVYNLHWIYFIVDGSKQYQHALRRHIVTGLLFGTMHFPLNMALIAFGASLGAIVQLRDFPGAQNIPTQEAIGSHALIAELSTESSPTEGVDSHDSHAGFSSQLSWLYCTTLAISLYCMSIIGVLHKGLDDDNYLRIRKFYRILLRSIIGTICLLLPLSRINSLNLVVVTSMLSLLLVIVETYGRLRKGVPLFGECEGDVISHPEYKKYIRWSWSTGILKKKKGKKNVIDDVKIMFE